MVVVSDTIVSQILPFAITLVIVAATGWLVGLIWAKDLSMFPTELVMKIAFVGSNRADLNRENRFLRKTLAREFNILPLSKYMKFGRLKRRFPVSSDDWNRLVDKFHDNSVQLLKIARVDVVIAVIPLADCNCYNLRIYSSRRNDDWFEPTHPGDLEFGPFEIDGRGAKFVVGALGVLAIKCPVNFDRMTSAGCGIPRQQYISSLQLLERRLILYKADLLRRGRPNFSFALKRLEAWLQLTLGRASSDLNRLKLSKNILCSILERVPNDIHAEELAKAWSLLAFVNREMGRNASGTELLEQSVEAATNAAELWNLTSSGDGSGNYAGLSELMSECLAIIGERQTDNDRLLQAADLRIQATDIWRQLERRGRQAQSLAALGNIYSQIDSRSTGRQYLNLASAAFEDAVATVLDERTLGWEFEIRRYLERLGDIYLEFGRRELDTVRFGDAVCAFENALRYNRFGASVCSLKRLRAKRARAQYFNSGLSGSKAQLEGALHDFDFANDGLTRPGFSFESEFEVESVTFHARSLVRYGNLSGEVRYYDAAIGMLELSLELLDPNFKSELKSDMELVRGEAYQCRAKSSDALADWRCAADIFDAQRKNRHYKNGSDHITVQIQLADCLLSVASHRSNSDENIINLAIDVYQQTLDGMDEQTFPVRAGHCYFGLAECLSRRSAKKQEFGDIGEAVKAYEKALTIWRSQGLLSEQVRTLCRLGTVLRDRHQLGGGLDSLRKSADAFGQALDLAGQTELKHWAQSIAENHRISERQISEMRIRGTYIPEWR